MTRTERASYPRALNRDRSESRNGLDSSLRKRGAGNYNWGSLADEHRLESTAQDDEESELVEEEEGKSGSGPGDTFYGVRSPMESSEASSKSYIERSTSASSTPSTVTEQDREKARNLRKNAFKKSDQIDLAAIARSSAAVSGSPDSDIVMAVKLQSNSFSHKLSDQVLN